MTTSTAPSVDVPVRCTICGARQEAIPGPYCGGCGKKLQAALAPVPRGPTGWCLRHPDEDLTGVCARCGAFTCVQCETTLRGIRYCESCRSEMAHALMEPVAWEERHSMGRLRAWWRTTVAITTAPHRFFEGMEPTGQMGSALSFGFLGSVQACAFQILFMLLYLVIFGFIGLAMVIAPPQGSTSGPHPALVMLAVVAYMLGLAVLMPVVTFIGFLFLASLQHLALRVFGAGGIHGITATLKVACYALGTGWCGLIPWGQTLHPFWWTGLMVVGTAKVHECSYTRSLSVIIPMLMMCVAPVVAYIVFVFAALIAGLL